MQALQAAGFAFDEGCGRVLPVDGNQRREALVVGAVGGKELPLTVGADASCFVFGMACGQL